MKVWRVGILFAIVAILGAMVVCHPQWLSENVFLQNFMTHEILSLLIVILTITLASVANIHLTLTRIVSTARRQDRASLHQAANDVRSEMSSNAWIIFGAFLFALAAMVWKGAFPHNMWIVAAAHAVGLVVLLLNVLVLHDIYRSIFSLAEADVGSPPDEDLPVT